GAGRPGRAGRLRGRARRGRGRRPRAGAAGLLAGDRVLPAHRGRAGPGAGHHGGSGVMAATLAERRESGTGTRPPAIWTVYVWGLEKLTAQLRVRIAAAACLAGPFAFAAALKAQDSVPSDTLLGR